MNAKAIYEEMKARFEGVAEVTLEEVHKSFGTRTGIRIRENGKGTASTLYLEDFQKYGYSVKSVCDRMVETYQNSKDELDQVSQIDWVKDFENVKGRILPRLVNPKVCGGYLEDKPHRDFADLALIYWFATDDFGGGMGVITVSDDLAEMWNVTEEELYEIAGQNINPELVDIVDVEMENMGEVSEEMRIMFEYSRGQSYVLTNKKWSDMAYFGAGVLPYMMTNLQERFSKFIVIPSSVHELIIVPTEVDCFQPDQEELTGLVKEVNQVCVEERERLSDHSYYWDGSDFVI